MLRIALAGANIALIRTIAPGFLAGLTPQFINPKADALDTSLFSDLDCSASRSCRSGPSGSYFADRDEKAFIDCQKILNDISRDEESLTIQNANRNVVLLQSNAGE